MYFNTAFMAVYVLTGAACFSYGMHACMRVVRSSTFMCWWVLASSSAVRANALSVTVEFRGMLQTVTLCLPQRMSNKQSPVIAGGSDE